MVREERDPEEERALAGALAEDRVRLVAVDVGLVARRLRLRTVRVQRPVLVQRVVVVPVRRRIDGAVPLAPAGRDLRSVPRPVPVQVLAEMDGVVPGVLQPHGERVRRVELVVAAVGERVSAYAVVVRVLSGEQRRTRRTAERERVEVVVERDALVSDQAAHLREHLHLGERLVVGLEDEDVGPRRLRSVSACARSRRRDRRENRRGQRHRCDPDRLPGLHDAPLSPVTTRSVVDR